MLKIKDNVDLKELIDIYGFKPLYDENTGKLNQLYRIEGKYIGEQKKRRQSTTITLEENKIDFLNRIKNNWWTIFNPSRVIQPYIYHLKLDIEDFDILYDLIKADLVEKVED